ncbi:MULTISPECIES: hypothetical protein [unclassified Bradyrhizobium]|uniref:hypothetical protein n=1 Tax=unclassified Bradyrhizobium TaxID=2631580 RepID=UPI0028E271CE|nr:MULTISPECIES: hypothetical protein [unclassified Bradyrhizobium]
MELYGEVYHPETGKWLASVKDGKIIKADGSSYKLDGDAILSESGEVLGYLSAFIGKAEGSGDLATKLFGRGK